MLFILLCVASDVGGYTVGVLLGRHPLAPSVSPKKTWEGLAGSIVLACVVGVVGVQVAFDGEPLVGVILGLATVVTATLGDLAESMLKRDLELKDMGRLVPGPRRPAGPARLARPHRPRRVRGPHGLPARLTRP